MRSFTDKANRTWTIDLTIAAAKRIKTMAGVDLLSDDQGGLLELIGSGGLAAYETVANCLYACVAPQAQQQNITDEQFGAELGAEQMVKATAVFVEELIDFFLPLRPPLGETLRVLWQKAQVSRREETRIVRQALESPEIDRAMAEAIAGAEEAMTETIGKLCTNSPASSASTPPA